MPPFTMKYSGKTLYVEEGQEDETCRLKCKSKAGTDVRILYVLVAYAAIISVSKNFAGPSAIAAWYNTWDDGDTRAIW